MKAYLAGLALVSTVAIADCSKEQIDVIKSITEGIKTRAEMICRDDVLYYKDLVTHPTAIAVAKDNSTALCMLVNRELVCRPIEADRIRKSYMEVFNKKSI